MLKTLTVSLLGIIAAGEVAAMEATATKVILWRKGETIAAEEFVAASEEIVDYLATLPRPTEGLKGFPYNCMVKSRTIRPSVNPYSTGSSEYVYVRMVYGISDCKKIE